MAAKASVAIGLLAASLILLIIYGADVIMIAQSAPPAGEGEGEAAERRGFLPFNESVRGSVFGGLPVVMSIIAFVMARKERAPAVTALLFVNGGLIIAGMVALIAQGALAGEEASGAMRTVGSTIGLGAILVGLGAWKAVSDRKVLEPRKEPSQK